MDGKSRQEMSGRDRTKIARAPTERKIDAPLASGRFRVLFRTCPSMIAEVAMIKSVAKCARRRVLLCALLIAGVSQPVFAQGEDAYQRLLKSAQAIEVAGKEGWQTASVGYSSRLHLTIHRRTDNSRCVFITRVIGAPDISPYAFSDRDCDGSVESIMTAGEKRYEQRSLSKRESEHFEEAVSVARASFDAAARIQTVINKPKSEFKPDSSLMAMNRKMLPDIAFAATRSALRGDPSYIDRPSNYRFFTIFVNDPREVGGSSLSFSAEATASNRLTDCDIVYRSPEYKLWFKDSNCDSVFDAGKINDGPAGWLNVAGSLDEVNSVLIDLSRFALIANTNFQRN